MRTARTDSQVNEFEYVSSLCHQISLAGAEAKREQVQRVGPCIVRPRNHMLPPVDRQIDTTDNITRWRAVIKTKAALLVSNLFLLVLF